MAAAHMRANLHTSVPAERDFMSAQIRTLAPALQDVERTRGSYPRTQTPASKLGHLLGMRQKPQRASRNCEAGFGMSKRTSATTLQCAEGEEEVLIPTRRRRRARIDLQQAMGEVPDLLSTETKVKLMCLHLKPAPRAWRFPHEAQSTEGGGSTFSPPTSRTNTTLHAPSALGWRVTNNGPVYRTWSTHST